MAKVSSLLHLCASKLIEMEDTPEKVDWASLPEDCIYQIKKYASRYHRTPWGVLLKLMQEREIIHLGFWQGRVRSYIRLSDVVIQLFYEDECECGAHDNYMLRLSNGHTCALRVDVAFNTWTLVTDRMSLVMDGPILYYDKGQIYRDAPGEKFRIDEYSHMIVPLHYRRPLLRHTK